MQHVINKRRWYNIVKKRLDFVKKKYGFDNHDFDIFTFSTGEIGIISTVSATIPLTGVSIERGLEIMFNDMLQVVQISLSKLNPNDPGTNQIEEKK